MNNYVTAAVIIAVIVATTCSLWSMNKLGYGLRGDDLDADDREDS